MTPPVIDGSHRLWLEETAKAQVSPVVKARSSRVRTGEARRLRYMSHGHPQTGASVHCRCHAPIPEEGPS
jgi:hypothetical protein